MADKVKIVLHPEAVVYVFRHGHTAPSENGDAGDFGRALSAKGIKQSYQLGLTLQVAELGFQQIVCSAASRSRHTAEIASQNFVGYDSWYNGQGREFYSPASDEDYAGLWAATHLVEKLAEEKKITSAMSYSAFKAADHTGFMDRFMDETREVVLTLSGIEEARRIAIFDHAVIGNAVAEALFPQHRLALEKIELAPCDCIRLTATTCQHIPLMT